MTPERRYAAWLAKAAREAARTLSSELALDGRAAAEAYAAAAALVLCALSRHETRRGAGAASAVVAKYARPADLDAPSIAVRAHLARPSLDARLGGLLGDAGPRLAAWLARRTAAPEAVLARAVAAVAPLALGAASRATGEPDSAAGGRSAAAALSALCARVPPDPLDDPDRLLGGGPVGDAWRRMRRAARPWLSRFLRL